MSEDKQEKKVFEAEIVGRPSSSDSLDVNGTAQGSPFNFGASGVDPMKALSGIGKAKSKLLKFGIVFLAVALFSGYVGATAESTFTKVISIIGSGITGMLGMFMILVFWRLRKFKLPGM